MVHPTTTLNMFRNTRDAVTFAPDQVIFAAGEPGDSMYVVIEGEVDISIGTRLVRTLGPGGVFGEMALVEHGPRSATATARGVVRLVVIDERRFHFLAQQTPFFALQIMRIMSERLRAEATARP